MERRDVRSRESSYLASGFANGLWIPQQKMSNASISLIGYFLQTCKSVSVRVLQRSRPLGD